jgi:hypothetical protein
MAKNDIEKLRDKSKSELEAMESELLNLQKRFRKADIRVLDPDEPDADGSLAAARNAALEDLNAHKRQIAMKADEYAELARTASRLAGGNQFTPSA